MFKIFPHISGQENITLVKGWYWDIRPVVKKSNPSQESLGNPLTNVTKSMQNILFTTSPDRTTSTPEKVGANIDKMTHEFPTICSWVSNGFFVSIFKTHSFLLSGNINVYKENTYYKYQLMRLNWYHQNPHFWKGLI